MPIDTRRTVQQSTRARQYLNKDFDGFRSDLEEYARTFFPDKIQDFSPNGFGGLLIELASYVGDVQSFYLDHQFGELNAETAVEPKNLEKLLREAGVAVVGAAPAVVRPTFYFRIPAVGDSSLPATINRTALPVLKAGTVCNSNAGVQFQLVEDIDFTSMKPDGTMASYITTSLGDVDPAGVPINYVVSAEGDSLSSVTKTETFTVTGFEPFKQCTLQNKDVTDIISVADSDGNVYYEVDFLTQDTVFKFIQNKQSIAASPTDQPYVDGNLEVVPAPYRFYKTTSLATRQTTLTFGGGSGNSMNDDLVPDPSTTALPLYGRSNFSRISIDPNTLLKTGTLGAIAPNVVITVTYRAGGGMSHNIPPQSISEVAYLNVVFPGNPTAAVASAVRASVDANNSREAAGGADAPSLNELRLQIPSARNAQSRIVSKEDLVARIYSLPANFGRVYRASVRNNPDNPNAAMLFVLSRNTSGQLVLCPDLLKKNLAVYLNQYRMISDAIDIFDGRIVNLQINYDITVDPTFNRQLVLQTVQSKLVSYFNITNFQMDQPLVLDDVRNIIYNNTGVLAVRGLRVQSITGTVGDRTYSDVKYDINTNLINDSILIPPTGGLFEIKYKSVDLNGRVAG